MTAIMDAPVNTTLYPVRRERTVADEAQIKRFIAIVRTFSDKQVDDLTKAWSRKKDGKFLASQQELDLFASNAVVDKRCGLVLFLFYRNTVVNPALRQVRQEKSRLEAQARQAARAAARTVRHSVISGAVVPEAKPAPEPTSESNRPRPLTSAFFTPAGGLGDIVTKGFVTLAEIRPAKPVAPSSDKARKGGKKGTGK